MFSKLNAFSNAADKPDKVIVPLDLADPCWKEELTADLKCFADKVAFDAKTQKVKIESIALSLQVSLKDLVLSSIDKTGRYLIFGGWGFRGEIRGVVINPQDRLYLELYNGFCGACDFDVDCWNTEIFLGSGSAEKKEIRIGIRN